MADQPVPQTIQLDAPDTPAQAPTGAADQPPQTIQLDDPSQSTDQSTDQPDHDSVLNTDPVTGAKIGDLAKGLVKGAGQTVNAISGALSHVIPAVVPPNEVAGLHTMEQPQGPDQKIGLTMESIAEFLMGDEALKGLSLGEKYAKIGKLMDTLKESSSLRRAVNLGIQSMRQGTVAGVQALAHGATPTEAATTGVEGAALGTGAGLATDAIGAGAGMLKTAAQRTVGAFTETSPAEAGLKADSLRNIQPKLQNGLRSMLSSIESEAGIQPAEGQAANPSIRDAVSDTADKFYGRAKAAYADLDAATGGHFQRFENALRDLNREANEFVSSPDEENLSQEHDLARRRAVIEEAQDAAFDRAKAQGVDPSLIENARADFKKSQALYDLDFNVKKSISGGRPELFADPTEAAKNPEIVDPKKLDLRLNNLYDSGRLQEAVGTPKAKQMLKSASDSLMEHRDNVLAAQAAYAKRAVANKAIRTAVKVGAGAAGLSTLAHVAPSISHHFIPGVGVIPVE